MDNIFSKFFNKKSTFIVAELSANHNNDFVLARKTIQAMKESGADAVKFQTYTPDSLSLDYNNEYFGPKKEGLWKGQRPYDVFKEGAMPWKWQLKLKKIAEDIGLICFSSPFDIVAVDFLEKMNVPAYKIGSYEISDVNLIEYVAKKQKPIIISTGVAEESDIEEAIKVCKKANNDEIILLKCTSAYPTPYEDVNLRSIPFLRNRFKIPVGLSDHTLGQVVPVAAVTLGAIMVEKHFILDRNLGGIDSVFSMEPKEFKEMVKMIRITERALGESTYRLTEQAKKSRSSARSLFIVEDVKRGEKVTEKNIRSIRPGAGLHPRFYKKIIGQVFARNLEKGTPLSLDDIEK